MKSNMSATARMGLEATSVKFSLKNSKIKQRNRMNMLFLIRKK